MERHLGRNFRAVITRVGRGVDYDIYKGATLVACGYAIEGDEAFGLDRCRALMAESMPGPRKKVITAIEMWSDIDFARRGGRTR